MRQKVFGVLLSKHALKSKEISVVDVAKDCNGLPLISNSMNFTPDEVIEVAENMGSKARVLTELRTIDDPTKLRF
jgi:hypothetical protein